MKRLNSKITLTKYRKINCIPTNKELKQIVIKYIKYKDWYKNSLDAINEKFPYDTGLFIKCLAITSQQQSLKENVNNAIICFTSIKTGNDPLEHNYGSANQAIQGNIKRILSGNLPRGNKILPFTLALRGDLSQIVIDTHMIKFFSNNKKRVPCKTDIKHISSIINKLSTELKIKPSETQACLWVYIKKEKEYSREKNDYDYKYYLERAYEVGDDKQSLGNGNIPQTELMSLNPISFNNL